MEKEKSRSKWVGHSEYRRFSGAVRDLACSATASIAAAHSGRTSILTLVHRDTLLEQSPARMPAPVPNIHLHRGQRPALRAVAMFEFTKGIFVLVMGVCALLLVHRDLWLMAESLLALLHINTDRRFAQLFLNFADNITDARLWAAARIAFAYAVLRFTEAYGLWKARSWAEWMALISGTLLLPFEVRELLRGVTIVRVVLFLGNLAIVLYMFYLIRANQHLRRSETAGSSHNPTS